MNAKSVNSLTYRSVEIVREISAAWQRFWFKPADPLTLGMIRLLVGLMLTYNLVVWGLDLQAFFAADGLQPLAAITALYSDAFVYSFLNVVPADWLTVVHWSCVGVAVLFCLGVCTRLTSLMAFVIAISYSQRVPVANFGLDQILGMLCLYLAIGPSGAALSIDAWFRKRLARRRGLSSEIVRLPAARMALRLIQIHVCVIYFWAGFAKLKGDSWWTGEAMWQVMANMEYQTMDLTWMANVPWLPYLLAHVTVAWEVFFCVLVWNKTLRPFILTIGTAMHLGIGAFLGMWTFGLVMTFPYLAFARPSRWRRLAIWRTSQPDGEVEGFALPDPDPIVDDESDADDELHEALQGIHDSESESEYADHTAPMHAETDDDDVIGGDENEKPPVVIDYRKTDAGRVLDADTNDDAQTRSIDDNYVVNSAAGADSEVTEDDIPEPDQLFEVHQTTDPVNEENFPDDPSVADFDSDLLTPGAIMSTESKNPESKNELSTSRMERLKPKSANSLTGAPVPKIDGRVEDSVLAPETEVMLIALHAPERNTFRTYLRRHDIPCRAAISAENAVSIVLNMKPAAVLLSGSGMNPEEIITLVDDLNDMVDAPILALLTGSQIKLLSNDPLSAHVLQYPASLRQIREALTNILLEEGNAKPRCSLRSALTGD